MKDDASRPLNALFVSHGAGLTGAPLMLTRLVRWLVNRELVTATVLVGGPGDDLLTELRELGTVVTVGRKPGPNAWRMSRIRRRLEREVELRTAARSISRSGPFDVVYSSTLTTGRLVEQLVPASVPMLSRVSELDHWLAHRVEKADLTFSLGRSDRFICVSRAVQRNLVEALEVDAATTTVLPGFVERTEPISRHATLRQRARAALGIDADDFVVGGVGTTDWRKGPDLFIQIAAVCQRQATIPPTFVWIGGRPNIERAQLEHDLARMNAQVRFVDERRDADQLVAAFDLLCVTSREDPYPVVMMECGAVGVPTLCFSGSGGAEEFAGRGGGISLPYLDVRAMTAAILDLEGDRAQVRSLGQGAHRLVGEHHTVDVVAPQIHHHLTDLGSPLPGTLQHVARR